MRRALATLARSLERSDDPLAELPTHGRSSAVCPARSCWSATAASAAASRRRSTEHGIAYVVAEQNREIVEKLRARNIAAVSGDASDPAVLIQAHIARAGMLVIATPDTFDVRRMVEVARAAQSRASRPWCARTAKKKRALLRTGQRRHGVHGRARAGAGHDAARAGADEAGIR